MMRLPGYRWPYGMEQTPAKRRFRLPPRHWNPEPKFGLRVAPRRPLGLDEGDYISVQRLSDLMVKSPPLMTAFRHMRRLEDDDYIVFANERALEPESATPDEIRRTTSGEEVQGSDEKLWEVMTRIELMQRAP